MIDQTKTVEYGVIQAEHVAKKVQTSESEITILRDVTLTISKAESVAIVGESGSGKTTLLTLLAGLDLPTSGNIYINRQCITRFNEDQRAKLRLQQIGFIFQSFQLIPSHTALENTMLPLEIQGISTLEAKKIASDWLDKVGLSKRLTHFPSQLSGGEQQRVAIARAFVTQPKIIFADEMTGNLDTQTGEVISNILFSLNQQQSTTLVLVTHDVSLARRCNQQLLLRDGVITPC